MARIRTIKPDFFTSSQIAECSTSARLLFVGMWCFCDDAGRHPANTKRLKMEIYPADTFTDEEIKGMVLELLTAGLIDQYEANGEQFIEVKGWHHQKIERRTFKYPDRRGRFHSQRGFDDRSPTNRRRLDDASPPEGKGRESKGSNTSTNVEVCGEMNSPPTSVLEFPCVGNGPDTWGLTEEKLGEYRRTFPGVDVLAECRKARQWCIDNQSRRKTYRGMAAFLGRWLSSAQDKKGRNPSDAAAQSRVLSSEELAAWSPTGEPS